MTEARGGHLYTATYSLRSCKILWGGRVKRLFLKAAFLRGIISLYHLSIAPAILWFIPMHLEERWARHVSFSLDLLQGWKLKIGNCILYILIICVWWMEYVLALFFPDTQDVRRNRKHQQRRILSNDELLYDPEEDSRDQEWVDSQRRG